MAADTRSSDRHLLFHGELSDAPGRDESWDEYVRYRGNNKWELIIESTDFFGTSPADPVKERMSTKALVNWVIERDDEIEDDYREDADVQDDTGGDDTPRKLGPRGDRLYQIASGVEARYCLACLDGWLAQSWPLQPAVRILDINGVTRRGVWIRVHHCVYTAETNFGPAFLYPPGPDRIAKLILATEGSLSAGRRIKVPETLMAKIEALKPALDALNS